MIEWIKTFVTVYQTLNFSVAAHQLMVSQPTVSLHIKNLEQEFKVKLFMRNGRQEMVPTKEADFLYPRLLQILDSLSDAENQVLSQKNQRQKCSIASSHSVSDYLLPLVVADLIEAFPLIDFSFAQLNSNEVMLALQNGTVNLGFLEKPIKMTNVKKEVVYSDKLLLVGEPTAPNWILREKNSGMRFFNEVYRTEQDIDSNVIESDSAAITKQLILSGLGRAVVSHLSKAEFAGKVPMEEYKSERYIYLATNVNQTNPVLAEIYSWLREKFKQII